MEQFEIGREIAVAAAAEFDQPPVAERRRERRVVHANQPDTTPAALRNPEEFRRNSTVVYDGIKELQDHAQSLQRALDEANARIEQYQYSAREMQTKVEAGLLDLEVERQKTQLANEALERLRTRVEGIGRLSVDALADLRNG